MGSVLSYKNMRYGLGKMIYALDDNNVHCVLAPDASITRNKGRWLSGYGYGGVIRWEDEDVAFPEIRPNACGMILMRLDELPDKDKLIENASEANRSNPTLEGVEINPDFGKGNHFFEFYEPIRILEDSESVKPEYYYAILHCSAPELKDDIYSYCEIGSVFDTPLGQITMLEGEEARDYYEKWQRLDSFSKKRRKFLAEQVVGSFDLISNYTHQGLFSMNEARLGCYDTKNESGKTNLYPVALRWDCPVYVFKGKGNLSEEILKAYGFSKRAKKLGVEKSLKNINILPHGGGYELKLNYQNVEIKNIENFGNVFTLSSPEPAAEVSEVKGKTGVTRFGKMTVTNPSALPYSYRGKSVIRKTMELDLGELFAELRPLWTLKV